MTALLETICANATEQELRTVLTVLDRAHAKPAVLVTLAEGSRSRRYVVEQEDEHEFDGLVGLSAQELRRHLSWRTPFGGRWLRGFGRVDEMYRTLSGEEVIKVEHENRDRVWRNAPVTPSGTTKPIQGTQLDLFPDDVHSQ